MQAKHERHGLVWPVILIGAGVVLLLNNMGILPWGIWQTLLGLWPVLLIAAGLDLLLGRRSSWGALLAALLVLVVLAGAVWTGVTRSEQATTFRTETISQALGDAKKAEVEVNFGVGSLIVGALPEATGNLVEGTVALAPGESVDPNFRRSGDTARYELRGRGAWRGPFIQGGAVWPADKVWKLALTRDVPLELRVHPGVGRSVLDLSDLTVTELMVDGNVGQVNLTLPRRGRSQITLDGGVGELVIGVPEGTAARIQVDEGLGGVVTEGRFINTGRIYTTPSYNAATERVEVRVKGGIGRLTLREGVIE
jgi:hypothetical protein